MINKRGQNLTLGTILLIILGLAVLVMLIYGFSVGWGSLFDRIRNIAPGQNNVDAVTSGCNIACSTQDEYNFCTSIRTVKAEDGFSASASCNELVGLSNFSKGKETKNIDIGIEACPAISC